MQPKRYGPLPPLKLEVVSKMIGFGVVAYLRAEVRGRLYYSADKGLTWHRTLARAMRRDWRGRAGEKV